MGEKALVYNPKPEPSAFANQESEAPCLSALSCERLVARELFPDVDSLKQGDTSLLQRIHRLDNILTDMEDKGPIEPSGNSFRSPYGSRRISSTPSSLEKRCQSTESVLEEVEEKGTLVERVSDLEKRVIKLHRIIVTKSSENVAFQGHGEVGTLGDSMKPHDQAMSDHEEHDQSLQDLVDVEKHEVPAVNSAPSECDYHHEPPYSEKLDISPRKKSSPPSECDYQHEPPLVYSEKLDINPPKKESPSHMEGPQGMASSEGSAMEAEDPRADRPKSKKKSQRIKRWITKRLHISSSSRKVETDHVSHFC